MSEVKRFDSAEVGKHYNISCGMEESPIGDYVLHSDYEKLEARLKVAVEDLEEIEKDQWILVKVDLNKIRSIAREALKELRGDR